MAVPAILFDSVDGDDDERERRLPLGMLEAGAAL